MFELFVVFYIIMVTYSLVNLSRHHNDIIDKYKIQRRTVIECVYAFWYVLSSLFWFIVLPLMLCVHYYNKRQK